MSVARWRISNWGAYLTTSGFPGKDADSWALLPREITSCTGKSTQAAAMVSKILTWRF